MTLNLAAGYCFVKRNGLLIELTGDIINIGREFVRAWICPSLSRADSEWCTFTCKFSWFWAMTRRIWIWIYILCYRCTGPSLFVGRHVGLPTCPLDVSSWGLQNTLWWQKTERERPSISGSAALSFSSKHENSHAAICLIDFVEIWYKIIGIALCLSVSLSLDWSLSFSLQKGADTWQMGIHGFEFVVCHGLRTEGNWGIKR